MRVGAAFVVAIVAIVAIVACGGEGVPSSDSAKAPAASPVAASTASKPDSLPAAIAVDSAAPAKVACASEGAWQPCSIEKRLTDAGFVPIAKGPAARGVFDIAGAQYALGPAELHVYIFPSAKERAAAVVGMDTVTVTRGPGQSPWAMAPTFITSNNLVAVLLSDNGRLIERVQLAITAGLPSAAQ